MYNEGNVKILNVWNYILYDICLCNPAIIRTVLFCKQNTLENSERDAVPQSTNTGSTKLNSQNLTFWKIKILSNCGIPT